MICTISYFPGQCLQREILYNVFNGQRDKFGHEPKDAIEYSNLPLKYTLWTRAIGVHLVGRCVLYSYRF